MKYPHTLEDAIALATYVASRTVGTCVTLPTRTEAEQLRNKVYYQKKIFRRKFPEDVQAPLYLLETLLKDTTLTFRVAKVSSDTLDLFDEVEVNPENDRKEYMLKLARSTLGGKSVPAESVQVEYERLMATGFSEAEMKKHILVTGSSWVQPEVPILVEETVLAVEELENVACFLFRNPDTKASLPVRFYTTDEGVVFAVEDLLEAVYTDDMALPDFKPAFTIRLGREEFVQMGEIARDFTTHVTDTNVFLAFREAFIAHIHQA